MTDNLSYIIIDDEEKAIMLLNRLISQYYSNLHMAGYYTSWDAGFNALKKNDFDLLFLDISMPHKSGLDLLELVPQQDAEIIFVTAHEEHALQAFNFNPSGYILKPVEDVKLVTTINKAIKRVSDKKIAGDMGMDKVTRQKDKICIHNNKGFDYINVNDILYFEATTRCTKIITPNKTYVSSSNIGKFKELTGTNNFYAVHRSYIVNIDRIKRYESTGMLIVENGHEIPVSKNVREDFLRLFSRV